MKVKVKTTNSDTGAEETAEVEFTAEQTRYLVEFGLAEMIRRGLFTYRPNPQEEPSILEELSDEAFYKA